MRILLLVAAAATLTACAKTPSAIPAIPVASAEYSGKTCRQLTGEYTQVSAALAEAEEKQRDKVAGDAVMVFLVLIPLSTMTGDHAADVGRYKGEKIAIERAMKAKRCVLA